MAEDRVDIQNAVMQRREPEIQLCRDVFSGTAQMRAKGQSYLPVFPGEKKRMEMYYSRLERTVLFNAVGRTVEGLTGMMFRRDPTLGDDVPKEIAGNRKKANEDGYWENIDLRGTHGDVFLREMVAVPALVQGCAGILVDYPKVPQGATLADEKKLKARPYWVPIEYHQVVSFRVVQDGGMERLSQLVLKFDKYVPVGDYVETLATEYRVFKHPLGSEAVSFEVWLSMPGGSPELVDSGVIGNQVEIPVAWCYAGERSGILDVTSPMLDMAYTNVAHYQTRSDHRTSLHYASVPVPVFIGVTEPDAEKTISSAWAEYIPQGGDFKYVEHAGSALAASRQELEDLKGEMATLGLAMLQRDTRAAETAEGKRIDRAASDSALAAFARSLQDCAEQALLFTARYMKQDDGGSLRVNRNFEAMRLEPADVQTYSNLVAAGQLSLDTMWKMIGQQGDWLPDDFDPDAEKEAIEEASMEKLEKMREVMEENPSMPEEMPEVPGGNGGKGKNEGDKGPPKRTRIEYDDNGRPSGFVRED